MLTGKIVVITGTTMRLATFLGFGWIVLFGGCTRVPLKDRALALRPASAPSLADDLGRVSLVAALESHTAFLATLKPDTLMRFGKRVIQVSDYVKALRNLLNLSLEADDPTFFSAVERGFEFHEVYGNKRWAEVLLTSYYEPQIAGSLYKTAKYQTPLLKRPRDLIEVAASRFDDRLADAGALRGRLWQDDRKRDLLLPYHTRAEIGAGALKHKGLELAWVDAVDAFFMHIQGSGTILLPGEKRLRLGYNDQNGHVYQPIGKFLTDILPIEKITLFSIEAHLRSLPVEPAAKLMDRNPSYVFFEKIEGAPKTSLGNAVFPGRTIATDVRYFPKGALAFLMFKRPVFASPTDAEPTEYVDTSRFVFDQDTGGAIRGGGRVDLFWGSGDEAKRYAGFMKDAARLYYLVPR